MNLASDEATDLAIVSNDTHGTQLPKAQEEDRTDESSFKEASQDATKNVPTCQHRNIETITLLYVSLGDLHRRWKQEATELHPALLSKVSQFRRIKINTNQSIRIQGSDDGLLAYISNINRPELVDQLYKSIIALPEPKKI